MFAKNRNDRWKLKIIGGLSPMWKFSWIIHKQNEAKWLTRVHVKLVLFISSNDSSDFFFFSLCISYFLDNGRQKWHSYLNKNDLLSKSLSRKRVFGNYTLSHFIDVRTRQIYFYFYAVYFFIHLHAVLFYLNRYYKRFVTFNVQEII